jgi:hypothetical protein
VEYAVQRDVNVNIMTNDKKFTMCTSPIFAHQCGKASERPANNASDVGDDYPQEMIETDS